MLTTRRLFQCVLWFALFALAARTITDGDFWWHLRTGQYILESQSIPHQDIFSYTRAGQEWVTHEWLSEVLLAVLYRVGGYGALIFVFAGIIATSFFLAFRRSTGNLYISAAVTLLGALGTVVVWDVRPQMIALLLTSILLWILDRYRRNPTTRTIWLLVLLMLLWVNLHGSFLLGLAIVAVYLVGEVIEGLWPAGEGQTSQDAPSHRLSFRPEGEIWPALRRSVPLAGVLALMVLVIVLNPNGARIYTYPFETLNDPIMQSQIAEWQSPDFHRLDMQPFLWLILALFMALALTRRRPTLTQTVLLMFTLFEALRGIRLIPLFVLVAIPILSQAIPIGLGSARRRDVQWLNWAALSILIVASVFHAGQVAQDQPRTEQGTYPTQAVEYIQREHLDMRMFNLYEWGGYLLWRLYPERLVFIDGRADVYGALVRDYLATYRAAPDWRDALERHQVGLVLIPPQAPLATVLRLDAGWRCAYEDEQAAIFVRR